MKQIIQIIFLLIFSLGLSAAATYITKEYYKHKIPRETSPIWAMFLLFVAFVVYVVFIGAFLFWLFM